MDQRSLLREYVKRFGDIKDIAEPIKAHSADRTYRWREELFDEQVALIDDSSKFKAAVCSRRAGKTYTVSRYLVEEAFRHPESIVAYIALTRSSAKRLMWNELKRANRRYHLGIKFNNADLVATLPNHSEIMLTGANDQADIDKLRGPAYRMVAIDECQSYGPFLDELIEEVLEPALVDHNGTLLLTGTPNAACTGYFYTATTSGNLGFAVHNWTIKDNPHIPHAADYLSRKLEQKNWDESNPIFRREWCGEWVKSEDSLVYRPTADNLFNDLPDEKWNYVLGIDLGYIDATSFSIGCYSHNNPHLWVIETPVHTKLIPSEIAAMVGDLNDIYQFESMVADTGGLGRSIVEEMRQRYQLPIRAAEKKNKASYIELFNDDLRTNKIKIKKGVPVLDEWRILQWDEDKRMEDKRFENHASDATLYMWREARHFLWEEEQRDPVPGEKGYSSWMEDQHWNKVQERIMDENGGDPWWSRNYTTN